MQRSVLGATLTRAGPESQGVIAGRTGQMLRNDVGTHMRSLGQGGVALDLEHVRSSVCELKPVLHGAPGWQLITASKTGKNESEAQMSVCHFRSVEMGGCSVNDV